MAKTDEGEFELVLGNRQLISVFLIMVILLGVFFSMGYIVGRNSAPATVDARNSQQTASKPIVVEPPRPSGTPDQAATQQAPAAQPPQASPAENTPAAQPPAEPVAPARTKPSAVKEEPPAPPQRVEKQTEPPSVRARAGAVETPPSGRYWQIVSTSRPEAEIVSETIAKKGFKALVAPAPKEGYYRVLVGPMSDAADMAKTRTQLEAAGFKNPILQKY